MSKFVISEERLNQLINESINEVIDESWLGDRWNGIKQGAKKVGGAIKRGYQNFRKNGGVAGAVGGAYQRARNKVANAKKDFEFARAAERAKNVDYDPLQPYIEKYGPEFAQKMVDNLGSKYGENRYGKMTDVRQGKTIPTQQPNGSEISRNPDLQGGEQQTPPQSGQTTAQTGNGGQQSQAQGGNGQNITNKAQGLVKKYSAFLKQKGFSLVNGQWVYTKDGSNSPALQSQYDTAMRGAKKLYEQKIMKIVGESIKKVCENEINEVGEGDYGQTQLGRLSAKRFVQYDDALQKGDHQKANDYAERHFAASKKAKDEHGKGTTSKSFERGFRSELKKQRRKQKRNK